MPSCVSFDWHSTLGTFAPILDPAFGVAALPIPLETLVWSQPFLVGHRLISKKMAGSLLTDPVPEDGPYSPQRRWDSVVNMK